jgi:hypothetical protein
VLREFFRRLFSRLTTSDERFLERELKRLRHLALTQPQYNRDVDQVKRSLAKLR